MATAKKPAAPRAAKKTIPEAVADVAAAVEKKVPGRKPAVKVHMFVEYQGKQVSQDDIVAAVKADCSADIKSLDVYVKPEDSAVYYVANGEVEGKIAF